MKVLFNETVIGVVNTNRSLTINEAIWAIGYDVNSPEDCEKAYNDGFEPAYIDDNGEYRIDTENCKMVY